MNGLIAKYFFSSAFIVFFFSNALAQFGQKELTPQEIKNLKFDSDTAKAKSYWKSYEEQVDANWPFFCTHWGGIKNNDTIPYKKMLSLLDSPINVTDIWDNTYKVKQFRFYYNNLEYSQNDTTLSYESRYFAYSFFSKFPLIDRWKKFIHTNIDPNETFIIDKIYVESDNGSVFIVYDELDIHTK